MPFVRVPRTAGSSRTEPACGSVSLLQRSVREDHDREATTKQEEEHVTYDDIREHVDAGKTSAEIVSILNADGRHHKNTTTAKLFSLLVNTLKVLRRNPGTGVWNGDLVNAMSAAPQALQDAFDQFLSNPWGEDAPIRCAVNADDPGDASDVGSALSGICAVVEAIMDGRGGTKDSTFVKDGLATLTGGRRFGSVTDDDVDALLTAQATQDSVDTLQAKWAAAQNDSGLADALISGDEAAAVQALRDAADQIEAS